MAKKVVTLYIDDTNIRLLVAKGKQVQKWSRLPLEPGLVRDGVIFEEDQVAGKIKELFKLEKVTTQKVIAGLSGLNSIYRLVTLPELPEAILAEAVRNEARRVIPVSLDQVYLSYQSLPGAKGETNLFLAAFPRNTADAFVRTLRQAGVEPYLMDLAPLSLCRNANESRAIIINAWLTHLDIVIMVDRVPQVIRSLSLPSEATSLLEMMPAITEEFERTVTFYNSSHLEAPLDSTVPVLVSGDLGETPESWQLLAGELNYTVSILPSPMGFPEGFNPSQFMINMGLALKELLLEKGEANFSLVNFNAQPEVYRPKVRPLAGILIPVAVAIVGIGLVAYSVSLVQNSTAQTSALSAQLADTEPLVSQHQQAIGTLKEQITQVEPQIEPLAATAGVFEVTFTNLVEVREQVNEDLSQIASLVPRDVALLYGGDEVTIDVGPLSEAKINHTVEEVTVTGKASEAASIFEYARALRSGGRFSSVIILSIEATTETIEEEGEEEEDWEVVRGYNFVFLLK